MKKNRDFLGCIKIEKNADFYESLGQYGKVYVYMTDMELLDNLNKYLNGFRTYIEDSQLTLSDNMEYWRIEIDWDKGLLGKIREWLKLHHGKFEREDWIRYTQTSNKQIEEGKVFM